MTCCSKCEYESISEPGVTKCLDSNCPCHSKDDGLEKVLREFDKKFSTYKYITIGGVDSDKIKSFITQVYKEAYEAGQEGAYLPLEESMAYKKGREEERERIRKELPKEKPIRKYYPSGGGVMEEHIEWNDCLNQVKKII